MIFKESEIRPSPLNCQSAYEPASEEPMPDHNNFFLVRARFARGFSQGRGHREGGGEKRKANTPKNQPSNSPESKKIRVTIGSHKKGGSGRPRQTVKKTSNRY